MHTKSMRDIINDPSAHALHHKNLHGEKTTATGKRNSVTLRFVVAHDCMNGSLLHLIMPAPKYATYAR